MRSDRRRFTSYGLEHGSSGAPSLNLLIDEAGNEELLPTKPNQPMRSGWVHRHITAGGGGYGHPFDRDPVLVLKDVIAGKVSRAVAERDYGVSIKDGRSIDLERTEMLRRDRQAGAGR